MFSIGVFSGRVVEVELGLHHRAAQLEMHDEIFHFEIFKNYMKILKYFKTLF